MRPRRSPASRVPWITVEQLLKMGLVRCAHDGGCSVFIDPANVRGRFCKRHAQRRRGRRDDRSERSRKRREDEFTSLAEVRFAPRPERARRAA